ncbi:hypothetical protein GNIT_1646 [Glaciecola nitratireducens FR1064]|uniref:Uncharacterized protein n=1 Tax=Glaciecola nitratireducens (strain JCM 12485 / KCTC 12276 / FR1064) TaxID=1085623 RepID=G4QHD1_GLANF|nr:hypothetical protein GNIT_1646 [Glaciecola nitratireducens FR1064]
MPELNNKLFSVHALKAYLKQTLKPWLENIESSLLMKLLPE